LKHASPSIRQVVRLTGISVTHVSSVVTLSQVSVRNLPISGFFCF